MIKKIGAGIVGVLLVAWVLALIWPQPSYEPYEPDQAYREKADAYLKRSLKPLPENWQWGTYMASDNQEMRWGSASPAEQALATVIFVPGYTGALEMYSEYYHEFLKRGYRVVGFDLRGQGGSARMLKHPEKPWVSDFGDYSDDLAGFVEKISATTEGPLYLMGESLGGHVSLRVAGDHAPGLDGLILVAPAMKIQTTPFDYGQARFIVELARKLGFGKKFAVGQGTWQPYSTDLTVGNYCGDNISKIYVKDSLYTARPELRVAGGTNQWMAEMMESSARINKVDYLSKIDMQILLLVPSQDNIVQGNVSRAACKNSLPNCRITELEGAGHCLISEPDNIHAQMFSRINEFITGNGRS